jgi:ABC-type branched-subunit amino acid transport system ATPase component
VSAAIQAYWTGPSATYWLEVIFGVSAIVVAVQGGPTTTPERLRVRLVRLAHRRQNSGSMKPRAASLLRQDPVSSEGREGLEVSGLSVRFGGLTAVRDVSLRAPLGRITGLIGPNGAGKTTTFNACCGVVRANDGTVRLHGVEVTEWGPSPRARRGLGRTFQIAQLCDSLSVQENVALAPEANFAGSSIVKQVLARRNERANVTAATDEAMELCGIGHLAAKPAGLLTTGQRRLVELARCLAGPFDIMLLDEPGSGLDQRESDLLAETLERVISERECGMLLVEHDMALVMRVCSYIYVLDFGQLIFEGRPTEVAASQVVQEAYLGESSVELIPTQPEALE